MDDVYYRPILMPDNTVKIVCMQGFDEYDYDQSRFLTTEKFTSEALAEQWVEQLLLQVLKLYPVARVRFGL